MRKSNEHEQIIAAVVEQMSFPPYNLEQIGEDGLRLTLAVTGFSMDEINISVTDDFITISGQKANADRAKESERKFLHHGIAETSFQKQFPLWRQIKIQAASFQDGFLTIDAILIAPQKLTERKVKIKAQNHMLN